MVKDGRGLGVCTRERTKITWSKSSLKIILVQKTIGLKPKTFQDFVFGNVISFVVHGGVK